MKSCGGCTGTSGSNFQRGCGSGPWGSWDIRDEVEDFVAKKGRIPFLRLDPTSDCPLPPLRTDLVWVWPALMIAAIAAYALLR